MSVEELKVGCPEFLIKSQHEFIRSWIEGFKKDELSLDYIIELEELVSRLVNGKIDLAILPLHQVKIGDNSLKILALSERLTPNYALIVKKDKMDASSILKLPEFTRVFGSEGFVAQSLTRIRKDIDLVSKDETSILKALDQLEVDAAVLPYYLVEPSVFINYDYRILHNREFGHLAGQGFIALVTRRDESRFDDFKALNNSKSITISNLERKTQRDWEEKLNLHIETDKMDNFHAWVFAYKEEKYLRAELSQSTKHSMNDRIIEQLKKQL